VSQEMDIPIQKVNVEHLSLFNKEEYTNRGFDSMMSSILWQYYQEREPEMIQKIVNEKRAFGHSYTAKRLFSAEVRVMTDVIRKINSMGIYALYIYDALMVETQFEEIVKTVMNEIILAHHIYTQVGEHDWS
jgi:hypothetical protein